MPHILSTCPSHSHLTWTLEDPSIYRPFREGRASHEAHIFQIGMKTIMRNRKVAAYGALASLPWAAIQAYVLSYVIIYQNVSPWLIIAAGFLAMLIIGVPLGAIGAVSFFKYRERIPGRSTLVKAIFMCVIFWFLVQFFSTWPPSLPHNLTFGPSDFIGLMLWAGIVAHFIDKHESQHIPLVNTKTDAQTS